MNPATNTKRSLKEIIFQSLTRSAAVGILVLVASLIGTLLADAWPVLHRAGAYQLFTSSEWIPKPPDQGIPTYGALSFIWGTAITSIIAMLLAVPLGVASATYMSEIAPIWLRKIGVFLIELLAAIPSVVYGFWGLFFLTPAIQAGFNLVGGPNTGGSGILAAGLILATMILPYITAITYDVCQAVPRSQREGSLALGATRWQTISRVVIPFARPGIIAASFLALGRALGETMAVTMLIGNQALIDPSPFALGDSIASRIATQLNEADSADFRSALISLALVLFIVTAIFNIFARFLLSSLTRMPKSPIVPVDPLKVLGDDESATKWKKDTELEKTLHQTVRTGARSTAQVWDRVMTGALSLSLLISITPLFLILGYVTVRGVSAVSWNLISSRTRAALTDEQFKQYQLWQEGLAPEPVNEAGRPLKRGGLGNAMLGSAMMVAVASIFAIPFALFAAVYLAEARNSQLATAIRFLTELLGGVPSIVIGIFAYSCLVYPFWQPGDPFGFNGWAGAFALAVMMIPIIVRSAEESMKLVPDSIRQASYALGASRMQTTLRVVLPASFPAIVTGVFLAIGRIAGETAPLVLTAGQYSFWPYKDYNWSPVPMPSLGAQTPFLPGYIFKYSMTPYADWQDQAWGGAVVLLSVVMLLNIGIRTLAGKRVVASARAE